MMDFLLVCSTPPHHLLWLHHKVRSLVRRWSSDLCATFTRKVRCCIAICFLTLGISNSFFLIVLFVMCWSFTSVILTRNMRCILRCKNTSILFSRDIQSVQLSHTHSNILMGMARKIRYLLQLLTLDSIQNCERDPIDAFPSARRASTS